MEMIHVRFAFATDTVSLTPAFRPVDSGSKAVSGFKRPPHTGVAHL